jgi:hypothetical protein
MLYGYKTYSENLKERDHLRILGIDGMMVIKIMLEKQVV